MQGLVSEFFSQGIGKPLDDFEQASARANSVFIKGSASGVEKEAEALI